MREASSEAMAAYAQGFTRLYGCEVPGSTASPVVKVVFDCLAEQKKEGQMGASQALLKVRLSSGSSPEHGYVETVWLRMPFAFQQHACLHDPAAPLKPFLSLHAWYKTLDPTSAQPGMFAADVSFSGTAGQGPGQADY